MSALGTRLAVKPFSDTGQLALIETVFENFIAGQELFEISDFHHPRVLLSAGLFYLLRPSYDEIGLDDLNRFSRLATFTIHEFSHRHQQLGTGFAICPLGISLRSVINLNGRDILRDDYPTGKPIYPRGVIFLSFYEGHSPSLGSTLARSTRPIDHF